MAAGAFALAGISFAQAPAQQGAAPARGPAAPPALMTTQLKPNVYLVTGGGGNSTVIVGNTSVLVVDAKVSVAAGQALVAEIAKVTPKPITTVLLTHSDPDHITGVAAMPAGVKVIANEGNKREQAEMTAAGGRGVPPPQSAPTQVTTKTREAMTIDGVKLELYHWGPAHTQGDLVVYLPAQKILATGDIVQSTRADDDPLMHYPEKRGSSQGWIDSVKAMIALDVDTYVPGHGDPLKKADMQKRLAATTARRNRIIDLVKQGKTLDEVRAASPSLNRQGQPLPAAAPGALPTSTFVELVYAEATEKK
jgi:glyoxylase-like metal-dependent hydrolase (beta-lactamase superfamily II)